MKWPRKKKENENSAGWLPEMSFQTVLSLVGVAFTAFELYQRFRPKSSSGSAQSPISPQTEPKQSDSDRESGVAAGAKLRAPTSEAAGAEQRSKLGAPTIETSGNPVSSKIGMA